MKTVYRVEPMSREVQIFTTIDESEIEHMHHDIKHLVVVKVADKVAEKVMEMIMPTLDAILKEVKQ